MFEIIFILVFVATLLVTGLTLMSVFAAIGLSLLVMLVLGMFGMAIKLLPWILAIAVIVWIFRQGDKAPR
ncbi:MULTISPECIES: envelope stress response protein PspG [Vibrio]|nr:MULTISPECIES: envelope stress response protein PspG [Vibrio]MBD0788887.1 envelope stress response protein PspG [Vibrio sp. Y2-5]MCF7364519.1 envelope stress response protein PspG [Vibrio sp. A1-b2]MCZ4374255.1 envelope stress response protein PspG [Vibrio diazotrophicus]MDW6018193.1 envelope stress response protein PspG [Vibrio plantisponsor]NNM42663.1 envelope stress response protein PspG [Vibrio plantisponsor]